MKNQTIKFHIKKNNKTKIHHINVPQSEITILEYLGSNSMTAAQISTASNGIIKIGSIYVLLKRLKERRLVKSKEIIRTIAGTEIKRVTYTTTFTKMEK